MTEIRTTQAPRSANAPGDELPFHPLADMFPHIEGAEFDALVDDIKKNGLQQPIVMYEGKILDGRTRCEACRKGGVTPNFVEYTGNDPEGFVVSLNIRRRHLTVEQRRDIIAKLIKQTPGKSDRQIADQAKTSPSTVGKVRQQLEGTGEVSKLDTRTDKRGVKQPATKAVKPESAKPSNVKPPKRQEAPPNSLSGCAPNAYGERVAHDLRQVSEEHQVAFVKAFGIDKLRALANPEQMKGARPLVGDKDGSMFIPCGERLLHYLRLHGHSDLGGLAMSLIKQDQPTSGPRLRTYEPLILLNFLQMMATVKAKVESKLSNGSDRSGPH